MVIAMEIIQLFWFIGMMSALLCFASFVAFSYVF